MAHALSATKELGHELHAADSGIASLAMCTQTLCKQSLSASRSTSASLSTLSGLAQQAALWRDWGSVRHPLGYCGVAGFQGIGPPAAASAAQR